MINYIPFSPNHRKQWNTKPGHLKIEFLGQITWSLKTNKHKKLSSMIAIHTQQQQCAENLTQNHS